MSATGPTKGQQRLARLEGEITEVKGKPWRDPKWSDGEYQTRLEMWLLNARLNASEEMLRLRIGRRRVNALIRQFRPVIMADPKLAKAFYAKRDPYRWLAQHWAPKQTPTSH